MTLLSAPSNNFIQDDPPSIYLKRLIAEHVSDGATEAGAVSELKDVLTDHLIDEAAFEALIADDYEAFLDARAKTLIGVLEQKWSIPIVQVGPETAELTDDDPDEATEDE